MDMKGGEATITFQFLRVLATTPLSDCKGD